MYDANFEDLIGYFIALVGLCLILYLTFDDFRLFITTPNKKPFTKRRIASAFSTFILVGGVIWFLLWIVSNERVPHGLYGLGIAFFGLVLNVLAERIPEQLPK